MVTLVGPIAEPRRERYVASEYGRAMHDIDCSSQTWGSKESKVGHIYIL